MNKWEVVIGIETHAQLATVSKIFSGASTAFGAEPNTQACAVDLALPGVLPVLNKKAVECAIRFGLAIGAEVAAKSVFARKNYFYPDLPKGYQISQMDLPVVVGGAITVAVGQGDKAYEKFVHLTRAHLEEDAGKSLHEDFHGKSGIDLNRAGTPLLEIVTEPDMRSSDEAVAYAKSLHALVRWIGICDGNMQEGSFRCDANVSVRPKGQTELGHPPRDQESQLLPFPERSHRFLKSSGKSTKLKKAARFSRPPSCSTLTAVKPASCGPRKMRTTTAISPIPICCHCTFQPTGLLVSKANCRNCRPRSANASSANWVCPLTTPRH